MTKKVLHVIPKFSFDIWAGAESAVWNISRILPSFGYESEVYSITVGSAISDEVIDKIRVRRFRGFYPGRTGVGLSTRKLAQVGVGAISPGMAISFLCRRDIDLVHLHAHNKLSTMMAHLCRWRGIPYVYTIHSMYTPARPPLGLTWASYEWGVRHADKIITVGSTEYGVIRNMYPSRADDVSWIPNGVDLEFFRAGQGQKFRGDHGIGVASRVILQVGRFAAVKNQIYSVKIFERLLAVEPDSYLVLIGSVSEPEYYERLRQEIGHRNLWNRVRIIPGLKPTDLSLASAYDAADLLLLPSLHEAQGMVILEAWATGVPVLASPLSSLSSMIVPGRTGEFLPASGDIEEAVHITRRLLDDRHLYRGHINVAVERYNWREISKQLSGLYDSSLRERGRA